MRQPRIAHMQVARKSQIDRAQRRIVGIASQVPIGDQRFKGSQERPGCMARHQGRVGELPDRQPLTKANPCNDQLCDEPRLG